MSIMNLFLSFQRNQQSEVGAQATDFGRAIDEINRMLSWRLSHDPIMEDEAESDKDPKVRHETRAKIFLGYTSNMISCGTRETIRFLVKHKLVDVIVTTCGGIEEDFIKCMGDFQVGDFNLPGTVLRERGQNRIGNILVSNDLYCKFEEFMTPILLRMLKEQKEDKTVWSPSKMIHLMGEIINNPDSVYYWCYKNNIPVFCPAITDGAIGDNIFFFNDQHPGLVLDLVQDISLINWEALHAKKTGMIICGGGVIKHHIANANLMRNGADFSVYINTGNEKEASDTGASPDEAVSWGKITQEAKPVKVWGDFTILFPLIVSQTFAKSIYSPLSEDHRRMPVEENKEEKHE
ncbi:putative Deoxyhypusine synthase [Blattamonas nauphoetae]|uniref:Deoxyhypusine synthase n=1 Tax=Blattamonas nauphoetae TaxID=2049346 RepID=A0ABQ9XT88_9EUKA|nr:putative Deoxyhypusine synthase [Blattamonas nauphoetae]